MRRIAAFIVCLAIALIAVSPTRGVCAAAQTAPDSSASAAISGTVADGSGKPVARAQLTLKTSTGEMAATAESDPAGKYTLSGVKPGEYDLVIAAEGFAAKTTHVSLVAGQELHLDLALAASGRPQSLPNAPSGQAEPSLSDLGFSTQQTQGDPKLQAILQRRTEMLRVHQRLGLITTIPMVAALLTGGGAKVEDQEGQTTTRKVNDTNLNLHFALGAATGALYGTTAYYAMMAPRVPGTHKHGAIRFHEALAWIHGPGMVATGVLGIMAWKQENSGERVHGIASAHGAVAVATTLAYGTSMIAVSWPIHIKFWENK